MKKIQITIFKAEITSDVLAIAHVTGRRLFTPETIDTSADIQSPDEGPDKYIVARSLQTALGEIRLACARYLHTGRLEDDNSLESPDGEYRIVLHMPDTWNCSATSHLTVTIHNCMVDSCVYGIFEKTNPQEAAVYATKAAAGIESVKSILELRTAPVKRPLHLY